MSAHSDSASDRRRVEVWRGGRWVEATLPELRIGEVVRMFEATGEICQPANPFFRVTSPAVPRADMPGRYSIQGVDCSDPAAAS